MESSTMRIFAVFFSLLFASFSGCTDIRFLETNLLQNYSKIIKPRKDQTQSVLVNITFTMNTLRTVEERYQYITFMGWFIINWYDDYLKWNESEYSGLRSVNIPYQRVWVPDVSMYFSETNTHDLGVNPFVTVYSDGKVTWYPGDQYTIECLLNIQKFPFDEQSCELRIAAWQTTDWTQKLVPKRRLNEMTQMSENGEWEFVRTGLKSVFIKEFNMTEVRYTLFLKRRPVHALLSTVFPVILLAVLNSLVYGLPVSSGERMTYCLTVLLAFTVFLTLFEQNMPKKSTQIPFLSAYLCAHLLSIVISIIASVFVIHQQQRFSWLYNTEPHFETSQYYSNYGFEDGSVSDSSDDGSYAGETNIKANQNLSNDRNGNPRVSSTKTRRQDDTAYDMSSGYSRSRERSAMNYHPTLTVCYRCSQHMKKTEEFFTKADRVMLYTSVFFTIGSTLMLAIMLTC